MASCTLSLDVDHPDDMPLIPGQRLTGHLIVDVDSKVKCRKLTVDFFWHTHGSGNRDSGPTQRLVLFEGNWEGGEYLTYPFEFVVPNGPHTYHGEKLNVDWYIFANADIPWAFDPSAEQDFLLDASSSEAYDFGPHFIEGLNARSATMNAVITVVGGVLFVFGLGLFCSGLPSLVHLGITSLIFTFFSLIAMGSGGWMVFSAWRSKVAERLLGSIEIQVPDHIRPGERFDVLLHCEPKKDLTLNNVTMTLSGQEVVVRGSGTNRTTYTHDVYEQEQEFDAGRVLVPGEHALFSTQFTLPANAGPSFAASDNELRWTIDIRFDIPNWPDWIGTYVLAVRP